MMSSLALRSCGVTLQQDRARIADAMLGAALRPHEWTVGFELLALTFVDRFGEAIADRNWPPFFEWVDRMCDKHGGGAALGRLFAAGAPTIAARLDATAGADLETIGLRVMRIVERPRAQRSTADHATLDEIDAVLEGLMSRLTRFDVATAEHSRAVSMWCARIGKKLALPSSENVFLMRAGLIHDIGKVTTPPEILNAPHRLSEFDMDIMRRHAEAGAAIVREIPQLEHLSPAVRSHHERIDGLGYPDGRIGSEIPLSVRIVSVADSFNAMIGNRPYRLPIAPTIALEQLRIHSGTQFDPNVVAAMIEVMRVGR